MGIFTKRHLLGFPTDILFLCNNFNPVALLFTMVLSHGMNFVLWLQHQNTLVRRYPEAELGCVGQDELPFKQLCNPLLKFLSCD